MEPERIAEHRAILAIREPWRTRGHAASKTTMSVPENIVPMVKKIEEIF
jgi:hypothetical protein